MAVALLDTNVLVHAVYRGSPLHAIAAQLVERGIGSSGLYCIAPQNLVEFAAVVTRARFVSSPLPGPEVVRITEMLYRSRRLAKIYPRRSTVMRAIRRGAAMQISGPRWYDLFLAMTMADAGIQVIVTENVDDFRAFTFVTARDLRREIGP